MGKLHAWALVSDSHSIRWVALELAGLLGDSGELLAGGMKKSRCQSMRCCATQERPISGHSLGGGQAGDGNAVSVFRSACSATITVRDGEGSRSRLGGGAGGRLVLVVASAGRAAGRGDPEIGTTSLPEAKSVRRMPKPAGGARGPTSKSMTKFWAGVPMEMVPV